MLPSIRVLPLYIAVEDVLLAFWKRLPADQMGKLNGIVGREMSNKNPVSWDCANVEKSQGAKGKNTGKAHKKNIFPATPSFVRQIAKEYEKAARNNRITLVANEGDIRIKVRKGVPEAYVYKQTDEELRRIDVNRAREIVPLQLPRRYK